MLVRKRNINRNKKKPQVVPDDYGGEPTQGTDNTEQLEKQAQEEIEREQEEFIDEARRKRKKWDFMPLNHDMERAYAESMAPNAELDDKKHYRDEVFYGDEQKQKTEEIQEKKKPKLAGQDVHIEDDPGFWPPILYTAEDTKYPVYSFVSEKTGMDYHAYPLTWDQIGKDWTIIVLGKRRSGKTCFIKSLCGSYLRPFFPRVVVFTKTSFAGEYSKFIPDAHIVKGLDEKVLLNYFNIQKAYKELQRQGKFHGNMSLLIIVDDCLSDGIKYKKLIDEAFFEGRHLDICFIISSQDMKGISPACTGNADLSVVFNVRSERDKEAVKAKFCDFFKNEDDMEGLTNQITHKKWHVMAIDQSEPSVDPRFTIFCGRAPVAPPFVMGCKAWWRHNEKQLLAIVKENPDLRWLLKTDDWGVDGEEEFNQIM